MSITPLLSSQAEQCHIQGIGFVGITKHFQMYRTYPFIVSLSISELIQTD